MGLEAINRKQHGYDAVALEDSEVCVISADQSQGNPKPDRQRSLLHQCHGYIDQVEDVDLSAT